MGLFLKCDRVIGEVRCPNTTKTVVLVERDGKPDLDWLITPSGVTCPHCQEAEEKAQQDATLATYELGS